MTDADLVVAAGQFRIVDSPADGFLIDNRSATAAEETALQQLLADGLLAAAHDSPSTASFLLPALAALPSILIGDLS